MTSRAPADLEALIPFERRDVPLERLIAASPPFVRKVVSTLRFESQRTKTFSRRAVWLALVLFPIAIMALFRIYALDVQQEVWGAVLYLLVPQTVCILGLLLWISPVLSSELESRTWIYLAVRPGAKGAVLLGKYLNGVFWTATAAIAGLTIGVAIAWDPLRVAFPEPLVLALIMAVLVLCSCLAYGSLYLLLGVLFPRRAMVVCVAYTLVVEVLVSVIPAIVNQLTVQHRLFNVLFRAMKWELTEFPVQLDTTPIWLNLLALAGYTLVNLIAAACVLHYREYATFEQN